MPKRPSLITQSVPEPVPVAPPPPPRPADRAPSRAGKVHIGGYYAPDDPVITAFRHILADRVGSSQQTLLREALEEFVNRHRTARAFS